jgi:hypothetical protein
MTNREFLKTRTIMYFVACVIFKLRHYPNFD